MNDYLGILLFTPLLPESAQSFADGCNREHKTPTKMSAASLRNKAKEHLSDEEKIELEAIKNGEGI